jgi:hypothetical protein
LYPAPENRLSKQYIPCPYISTVCPRKVEKLDVPPPLCQNNPTQAAASPNMIIFDQTTGYHYCSIGQLPRLNHVIIVKEPGLTPDDIQELGY